MFLCLKKRLRKNARVSETTCVHAASRSSCFNQQENAQFHSLNPMVRVQHKRTRCAGLECMCARVCGISSVKTNLRAKAVLSLLLKVLNLTFRHCIEVGSPVTTLPKQENRTKESLALMIAQGTATSSGSIHRRPAVNACKIECARARVCAFAHVRV